MVTTASFGEDSVLVEVRVSDKIRTAAQLAAIADSKSVPEFLEDILIDYLVKARYLSDPVNTN